jgi:hypothetical protein
MTGLLKPKRRLAARELVVAARLPEFKRDRYTGDPFTSEGDVVLDCDGTIDGKPCGWHAMGPRADVKKAYDEHRKQYHQSQIGVVLLNLPRQ